MLRVNLLSDPEFRSDILNTIKGIVRGEFRSLFDETIKKEGWLERQFNLYFEKFSFDKVVEAWCNRNRWEFLANAKFKEVVATAVEDKVNRVLGLINPKVDQILEEKLKARLGELDRRIIREHVRTVLKDYNL